ncbi:hypothetical protein SAY87_017824 [Trapa incisa]|uniref:Uncharacterized protein n=1 Tax=Trapa incisa TaxID=236973 RepID=A0AAN7LB02_9MYRT|nr:hypothetical protein SAY87_017824 [Trapa incisa]
MRSVDNSSPSSPFASLGRSIFSFRREQVHSTGSNPDPELLDSALESFHQQVSARFLDLASAGDDELLSIAWIHKLLDAYICSYDEFRQILVGNKESTARRPMEQMVNEFFDKSVKALDICNAARDGIQKVRLWHKHLDIAMTALRSNHKTVVVGEAQFRRARKALVDLSLQLLEEKDTSSPVPVLSRMNRSFGRHSLVKDHHPSQVHRPPQRSGHSRSLSWSVSRSWSAVKQLQSITNGLVPPRGNEVIATNGLAIPLFTISFVQAFVLWVLVAAIPCQDRGVNISFSAPRTAPWAVPLMALHDRILEESKNRDRRNVNGLMKEIYQVERRMGHLTNLVDLAHFPLTDEQRDEVEHEVEELGRVSGALMNGLEPLEQQVREMFRRIANCRAEVLELLCRRKNSVD